MLLSLGLKVLSVKDKVKLILILLLFHLCLVRINTVTACLPLQDVTEEDINSELAVIHSQMAYIMQLQGRADEALQLYNQVIKLK